MKRKRKKWMTNVYKFVSNVLFLMTCRSSRPQVFVRKGVLKICGKFTENDHAEVQFQLSCFATLVKSHFGIGVLLQICCIFSERFFLKGHLWTANSGLSFKQILIYFGHLLDPLSFLFTCLAFIIKLCFTIKVNTICGGTQFLISGYQKSMCHKFNPQGPGLKIAGPNSESFNSRVYAIQMMYDGRIIFINI